MTSPVQDIADLNTKGISEYDAGDRKSAYKTFKAARQIDPTNLIANSYLGLLAYSSGDAMGAEMYYESVLAQEPSNRQAHLQLVNALHLQGKKREALFALHRAEKQFPNDREILHSRGHLAAHSLPGWHLPMLADTARNDAYEKAIQAKVKPGDIVLDIGTGSGLLAMMAARAGAEHVYACEVNDIMADLARQVIRLNGFEDKITILAKHSSQLVIGEDLPRKADLLICEIFDRALVGEGALPSIQHAWQALLADTARTIPESATLYGALVECPHLQRFHQVDTVNGFDLTPMNVLAHTLAYRDALISLEESDLHRVLSTPFTIKHFDFQVEPDLHFQSETPVSIRQEGQADSLLMWFDLNLAPGIVFSNQNPKLDDHLRQATQILLETTACVPGETLTLSTHYKTYFDFRVLPHR